MKMNFTKYECLKMIDLFMEYEYEEYSTSWKVIIDKCLKANNLRPWKNHNGIVMCKKVED
jgi:hypothetical protein